jgi:hypothetical protein
MECNKEFISNQNLTYHVSNNVCKKKNFCCKYCPAKFTSKVAMYKHMRDACKIKKQNDNEKENILERLMKLEEKDKKLEEYNKKQIEVTKKLEQDNKKLKEENEKIKLQIKKVIKTTDKLPKINNIRNTINGNVNTGTINNNNIIVVGYGSEDLSKLNKSDILKILQTGYNSTVKLTEAVHFNPNFPEYHNVYISNMKDKYAMMHDGKQWTLTTKDDLISKIYEDKKNYIEENLEAFVQSLHPSRKRALERWLDTDDEDAKVKEIKENIKLLLYNSKNMIIETKESIKNISVSQSVKSIKKSSKNQSTEDNTQLNNDVKEIPKFKSVKVRKNK